MLTINDLEAIHKIVETKVKELRLVESSRGGRKKLTPEQEHKSVKRVIGDTIQILLGYIEATDANPLF